MKVGQRVVLPPGSCCCRIATRIAFSAAPGTEVTAVTVDEGMRSTTLLLQRRQVFVCRRICGQEGILVGLLNTLYEIM